MHKLFRFAISLVIVISLAASLSASAEEVRREFMGHSRLGAEVEFSVSFDFSVFDGEERFTQNDCDRIAAFATGWRRWQGYPKLRDYDVLCYLPTKLDNPFRYVFFDVGKGDSEFVIKGNRVYRDGELYGASVTNKEEFEAVLPDAAKLKYLYMAIERKDGMDEEILALNLGKEYAISFSSLRYICVAHEARVVIPFLNNCRVEYFHTLERKERILDFEESLYERNVPVRVEIDRRGRHERVLICDEGITDREEVELIPIQRTRLRFLSISEALYDQEWFEAFSKSPSIEGICGYRVPEGEDCLRWLSTAGEIRIYNTSCYFYFDSDINALPPQNIVKSKELEFLSLQCREIPSGVKYTTQKLKYLSIGMGLGELQTSFDVSKIEAMRIPRLTSFGELRSLGSLRELSVDRCSIDNKDNLGGLKLSEVYIRDAEFTGNQMRTLMLAMPGGKLRLGYLADALCFDNPPADNEDKLRYFEVLRCEEAIAIESLLPWIADNGEIVFLGGGHVSEELISIVRRESRISTFFSGNFYIRKVADLEGRVPPDPSCKVDEVFAFEAFLCSQGQRGVNYSENWFSFLFLKYFKSIESIKVTWPPR